MNIQELHAKAIEFADIAFIKKFNGLMNEAKELFATSFELEKEAAQAAKNLNIGEPTVSVLMKGAAYLAINCGKYSEAEKLICLALSGEPPYEIAEELRNLLEEVWFERHLQLKGTVLNKTELQIVIAGKGIGYGMAKPDSVFGKINTFEKLTYRTAERKLRKPFRNSYHIPDNIKKGFQPYLSVPRASSFAFTIRIGGQLNRHDDRLERFGSPIDVIEDIVTNIGFINLSDYGSLRESIKDETYLSNFINLSRELAPDGKEINLVGLTIFKKGEKKDVQLTKVRGDIHCEILEDNKNEECEQKKIFLPGRLYAANEEQKNIRLKVKGDGNYSVVVDDGLSDIVKEYFGKQVKINGIKIKDKTVKLTSIDPDE
ncbi:hypothetical protein VU06_01490 [Desulfobulbus sp. F3]|nr:hypothetical protein [Desulfobulbus sp. F3]